MRLKLFLIASLVIRASNATYTNDEHETELSSLPVPFSSVLEHLQERNEKAYGWCDSVEMVYNDYVFALSRLNCARLKYTDVEATMKPWIRSILENFKEAEALVFRGRKQYDFCGALHCFLDAQVWSFYHLGKSPTISDSTDTFYEQWLATIKELPARTPNNRTSRQALLEGAAKLSTFLLAVILQIYPAIVQCREPELRLGLQWLRQLYKVAISSLKSLTLSSLFQSEPVMPIREAVVSGPLPATSTNWSTETLDKVNSMHQEDVKLAVSQKNAENLKTQKIVIKYQTPKTRLSNWTAFHAHDDTIFPVPLLVALEYRESRFSPICSIAVMSILSNAAIRVPQVITHLILSDLLRKPIHNEAMTTFCKELDNLGKLCFGVSQMYFRTVRSSIIATFLGVVEKYRTLLTSNALYVFPDKIDRSSVYGCLDQAFMELELVGKLHGRQSKAYVVCRKFALDQYGIIKTFQLPIDINQDKLISKL